MTTAPNRRRRYKAALLSGMAMLSALTSLGAPTAAWAWKPKTHIYLAEEAIRDALDNGKVTLYETDYTSGKIVGKLGEFDVDPEILKAIRNAPKQFRAGVVGPDAYPDIVTGQQIIHPDAAMTLTDSSYAANGAAGGTNSWLQHLWEKGFINNGDVRTRAFVLGYMTHAAGDVFAHTYVNHYTGGEFKIFPDPTNGVKHIVLEGYIGKRTPIAKAATPRTVGVGGICQGRKAEDLGQDGDDCVRETKQIYPPVDMTDMSIAGVEGFILDEMTRAQPGSRLETMLLRGEGTGRSVPAIFSSLRNGLANDVKDAGTYNPVAAYKRAWIKDIDEGLAAWPAVSEKVAAKLVFTDPGPADIAGAKEIMSQYVRDHLASMLGAPDAAVAFAGMISDAINAFVPPPAREFLGELTQQPVNWLIKGVSGRSLDEWEAYVSHPETNFDKVINRAGGAHGGASEHLIDLKTFNRTQLKIDDDGYANPDLRWKIDDIPAAFDTLQLTKMMLLGDAGLSQLKSALLLKGVEMPPLPARQSNIMLGWVRSLDAGNQWQGLQTGRPGASPRPAFAVNAEVYQKLFLPVLGETRWEASNTHGSSPAPATPPSPITGADLVGKWSSPLGAMEIKEIPDGAYGEVTTPLIGISQTVTLTPQAERSRFTAQWRVLSSSSTTPYKVELTEDRTTMHFVQTGGPLKVGGKFDAKRIGDPPPPQAPPSEQPPVVVDNGSAGPPPGGEATGTRPPGSQPPGSPAPPPVSVPSGPSGGVPSSATRLNHFAVDLLEAKVGPRGEVDVTLSVANLTHEPRSVGAGTLQLMAEDIDGLAAMDGAPLQPATGAPTPRDVDLPANGEMRIRYVIAPFEGSAPLRRLRVREYADGPVASYDISALRSSVTTAAGPPKAGSGTFTALTGFEVRLDQLVALPNGQTELFYTLRNTTRKAVATHGEDVVFKATGPRGGLVDNLYQWFPARGDKRPVRAHSATHLEPGASAPLRTVFESAVTGPVVISDGRVERTVALPPASTPSPSPLPGAPSPLPLPPATPTKPTQPTIPSTAGFQPAGVLMVRLDAARMDRIGQADVLLTVRNPTNEVVSFTDGTFHMVLADADGLGVEVTELHRAGDGPAVRFAEAPNLPPGGELKVRYILKPFEGGAPIRTLYVNPDAQTAPAVFDVSRLINPMASTSAPPPVGARPFVSLQDWDIRLDHLVKLPNGQTEVFFTARNATNSVQQTGGGEFEFSWSSPDGAGGKNARQLAPARGPRPRPLHDSAVVQPGQEARLRTFFYGPVDGPVTVTDWTLKGQLN